MNPPATHLTDRKELWDAVEKARILKAEAANRGCESSNKYAGCGKVTVL